jgi:hypothetical protein
VTTEDTHIVHVWLMSGDSALPFLEDVCAMLRQKAERLGGSIGARHASATGAGAPHFLADLDAAAAACLRSEAGIHRSQYVPAGSSTGRIETGLVGVELLTSDADASLGRPPGPILKTYNYPLGIVSFHASGKKARLDVVLRGDDDASVS